METAIQPKHSVIGASSCERWWNCPGSVALSATLPPSQGTIYSATGTVAHRLGERYLIHMGNTLTQAPQDVIAQLQNEVGRSFVEDNFEVDVTEDMVNAVEVYLDTAKHYMAEYGLDWSKSDLRTEVKFDLTHLDPEAFGTCDAVIVAPMDRIIVIDYKHGVGHAVEIENNKQLLYYALGAYYDLPEDERHDLGAIETVVVQPRSKSHDTMADGSKTRIYSLEELLAFQEQLRHAIQRVRENDPTLATGPHCRFCPAKPICPAIRRDVQASAGLDFDSLEDGKVALPSASSLSPQRISTLVSNAEAIKSWCSSVLAMAHRLAETGTNIPGYKLVEKRSNRRWVSEQDVEDAFGLEFEEQLYNKKLKSPAQLEKILKKRKSELEPYYETPSAGKTLVKENDERTGVASDSQSDFDEFTE